MLEVSKMRYEKGHRGQKGTRLGTRCARQMEVLRARVTSKLMVRFTGSRDCVPCSLSIGMLTPVGARRNMLAHASHVWRKALAANTLRT